MFNSSSPAALRYFRFLVLDFRSQPKIRNQKSKICTSCASNLIRHPSFVTRHSSLVTALLFLIGMEILSAILCPQEARTEEKNEFPGLGQRLNAIETKLMSIDEELGALTRQFDTVTNEMNKLKKAGKSKSFLSGITGIFRRRKLAKLYTKSQDLADRISDLQKKREPLVSEFVALADELRDKSTLRMIALMEVVREADLKDDITTRDETMKQISSLWQLAERTENARGKYAPETVGPERTITYPALLSDNPEELRLVAAILKDHAAAARDEATQLGWEIEKLKSSRDLRKRVMQLTEQMRRSDEERGAVGVGITHIPWASDAAVKREIEDIEEKMDELSAKKQEKQNKAEGFENQSKELERRASQIDAELKGKPEDD
jgi:uncharacterized coiled-coil DUF342 family protein